MNDKKLQEFEDLNSKIQESLKDFKPKFGDKTGISLNIQLGKLKKLKTVNDKIILAKNILSFIKQNI